MEEDVVRQRPIEQNNRSFSYMNTELQPSISVPDLSSVDSISQVEVPSITGEEINQVNAIADYSQDASSTGSDSILVLPNSMA